MIRKITTVVKYGFRYFQKRFVGGLSRNQNPCALIALRDLSPNRRVFLVTTMLVRSGFNVFIRLSPKRYLRWNDYGRMTLDYPLVFPVGDNKKEYDVCVTDDPALLPRSKKRLLLRYDFDEVERSVKEDSLYFPIMQHPNLLKKEMNGEQLFNFNRLEKDILIFFAGNIDRKTYDKQHFKVRYGISNRYELIQAILSAPTLSDRVKIYSDYGSFTEDMNKGKLKQSVVIFDASVDKIPQSDWLNLMARSCYFLALPGYTQPFCHNIVEAMMVGTVPVTEYGRFFYPELKDEGECIAFSGNSGLIDKVLSILDGRYDGKHSDLSKNAVSFYKNHLSIDAAASAVVRFIESNETFSNLILARAT